MVMERNKWNMWKFPLSKKRIHAGYTSKKYFLYIFIIGIKIIIFLSSKYFLETITKKDKNKLFAFYNELVIYKYAYIIFQKKINSIYRFKAVPKSKTIIRLFIENYKVADLWVMKK